MVRLQHAEERARHAEAKAEELALAHAAVAQAAAAEDKRLAVYKAAVEQSAKKGALEEAADNALVRAAGGQVKEKSHLTQEALKRRNLGERSLLLSQGKQPVFLRANSPSFSGQTVEAYSLSPHLPLLSLSFSLLLP